MKQIIVAFKDKTKSEIDEALNFFIKKKYIFARGDKYELGNRYRGKLGVFSSRTGDYGFVDVPGSDSFFIPRPFINNAVNGDIIFFRTQQDRMGKPGDMIARVVSTLAHKSSEIIGKLEKKEGKVVFSDGSNFNYKIINFGKEFVKADDWVAAKVVGREGNNFKIKITKKLGSNDSADLFFNMTLKKFNVEETFNFRTIEEARGFKIDINEELRKRTDLRKQTLVTIDSAEAKDLDDAISVQRNKDGYKLFVHIADVSNFVEEGTSIDKDAFSRGTSVYLIDKVVPMLPFELSNDLCSLNESGPKVAFTCEMNFDKGGNLISKKVYQSVIESSGRLTYDEVNDLFYGRTDTVRNKDITEMLILAKELSDKIKKTYRTNGMLDFVVPEVKVVLNKDRTPVDLKFRKQDLSENLIENFMVAANVAVAEIFKEAKYPSVYRIHKKPKAEKFDVAGQVLTSFNYSQRADSTNITNDYYQKALVWLKDKPYEKIVNKFLIQTMEKAEYSVQNIGHFGLGLENYTHFTSPIRRYPDLIVHRGLKKLSEVQSGKLTIDEKIETTLLEMAADHSSSKERDAISAERYLGDIMKSKYMEQFVGEEFEAYLANINKKGMFIEMDNTVSGFIDFSLEKIETPKINQNSNTIEIPDLGTLKLGDKIKVKVETVDPINGRVNFSLVR